MIIITQREIVVQERLRVEEKLYKVLLSSKLYIWQRKIVKWYASVDFGCIKSKVKGKSQAGGWGTGCRSRGPNQDKSLVFVFDLHSLI